MITLCMNRIFVILESFQSIKSTKIIATNVKTQIKLQHQDYSNGK